VCGVLQHTGVDGVAELLDRAADLQAHLMVLVDEDAAAFRAFLAARRAGTDTGDVAGSMSHPPLAIAAACQAIAALSGEVEQHTAGPMLGDVRAARHLARAASAAALDLAEQDIQLQSDPATRAALRREISRLRSHH
jgi:formiminotetrahydrofolate cyclodeaminase